MTKQEAIQKAYGEHWKAVKDYVRADGSLKESVWKAIGIDNIFHHYFSIGYYRPKSLQGLETNNGWIKIESEDDLPKIQATYHVILKNGNQYMRTFADKSSFFDVTHYQPIEKPQPPIY